MRTLRRLAVVLLTASWLFHGALAADQAPPPAAQQTAQQQPAKDLFPAARIEQLVAPIALYPDALLAQILMASTYPLDIVQAARWQEKNKGLKGEALEKAADKQSWDPSVKALVFFPSVLKYMNENLDWTQDLGDAVLGQRDDVMDAVQRLRREAEKAGTLKTTKQQRVERSGDTIVVQPADPKVVYVPSYNPSVVYGASAPPSTVYYPATYTTPVYVPPTTTVVQSSGTDNLVSFGAGALVGGLLTAAIMWDNNNYRGFYYGGRGYWGRPGYWGSPNYWKGGWRRPENINVNRNVNVGNVNVNRGIVGNQVNRGQINRWEHNPAHRGGVRYRNEQTRQKFSQAGRPGGVNRDVARGRATSREQVANLQRPQGVREARPATKDLKRPQGGKAQGQRAEPKRPASRPAKKPATREAHRPQSRPAKINAPAHDRKRTGASQVQRSAQRSTGGGAFHRQSGSFDRAASRRGAASFGGGHARGGRARAGGGGGGRGGRRR
jgi:hypothetical protein